MHFGRFLLAILSSYGLFFKANTLQEKIGKEEIQQLADRMKFCHRKLGLKGEANHLRGDGIKKGITSILRKRHQASWHRCSLSKRFFPIIPYSHGSFSIYSPCVNKWWLAAPNAFWPEYGWKDAFRGAWGIGAWNQCFPTFLYPPTTCGHWCSKYNT